MSKTKISEFSTTPGNNTDINGINIAEGCAPSGINNAIRELMSDLKEWQSGAMDVYVIPQGTAAAPGIQLYGDLDTGLYGYAANQLGVAVGGASAGYFSSAGWNGNITGDINATTIDTTNLEVTNIKAKDGTAAIALTDSTGVVTLARTTSATNSVNEMLVLEHYSTGTISAGFGSGIKFFGENTGGGNSVYAAIHAVWEGGIGDPSGGALVFLTDGYVGDNTERVRITSEGKVGIGTATPSTTLEVAGSATVTGAATLSATTQNIALGTSQTTGTWTAGGASQTGALTLDQSTKTHTLNLGTGATESGLTKTVNIGTGGVSTSTTTITIGSANGTSTTLNGTVTAATFNSTTIDTTNIEVTNIKAKDGSASATIADSTGVMTIASSVLTTTDINGGTIDGTTIGGSTAAAGTFTTATATTGNITTVNATTVDTTNLEVTNIKAKDGTAALSIADSTGAVTVATALTANGGAVFNENGADVDFRVEGDTDANLIFADASTDRVGIGTNAPIGKLDVAEVNFANIARFSRNITGTNSIGSAVRVRTSTTGDMVDGFGTAIVFAIEDNAAVQNDVASINAIRTGADNTGALTFSTTSAGSSTEKLRIDSSGNLGIGTTSPSTALQVVRNSGSGNASALPNVIASNTITSASPYALAFVGAYTLNETLKVELIADGSGVITNSAGGGLFTRTNHPLVFGTNNTEKARIDSSGNLGLGAAPGSPAYGYTRILDVAGQFPGIKFTPSGASTFGFQIGAGTGGFQFYDVAASAERMRIDASGNLVVGATSASSRLEAVAGTGAQDIARFRTGDATAANNAGGGFYANSSATAASRYAYMWLDADGANFSGLDYFSIYKAGNSGHVEITNSSNSYMTFGTNNTERARITSGGDFLVGKTTTYGDEIAAFYESANASRYLYVENPNSGTSTAAIINVNAGSGGDLRMTAYGTNHSTQANNASLFNHKLTGSLLLGTEGTERARIDSGGNWLVGSNTTTPQYGGFAVRPSGNNGSCLVLWNKDQATSSIAAEFRYLGVASGSITYTNTAVAYNTSSDYRLKDNQQPLTGSGDFIDALKPKTWNWKADGSKGVGFIAHEVQAVSPGSVVGEKDAVDEDGNPIMQAMEYGSAEFIANIIAELQSLRARVAQLEGK